MGLVLVLALLVVGVVVLAAREDDAGPVAAGRAGDACPAEGPGAMVGLDPATGSVRWTNVVGVDPVSVWPTRTGAGGDGDGRAFDVLSGDGTVRTVDRTSGAVRACDDLASLPAGRLAVPEEVGGGARARSGEGFRSVEVVAADGSLRWTAEGSGLLGASPAGVAVHTDPADEYEELPDLDVEVLDPATGDRRWGRTLVGSSAVVLADRLVVLDQAGGTGQVGHPLEGFPPIRIAAYDLADGREVWHHDVPEPGYGLFVAGDVVLAQVDRRRLVAYEADGDERWEVELPNPGRGGPWSEPVGGLVGVAEADGAIGLLVQAFEPYRD